VRVCIKAGWTGLDGGAPLYLNQLYLTLLRYNWDGHQWNCSVIYGTTRELLGLTGLVLLMTEYPL